MRVTYTIHGTAFTFDVQASDELHALCGDIRQYIEANCPDVASNPDLAVRITDGVLNSLADARETIDLGELAA